MVELLEKKKKSLRSDLISAAFFCFIQEFVSNFHHLINCFHLIRNQSSADCYPDASFEN
jgi:hypothetical protein